MKLFSVYDSKAEAWSNPNTYRSTGDAIRSFAAAVNDKEGKSNIAVYPEDYTLFELGEWNDATGQIVPLATPHSLGLAVNFKTA